MEISQNMTTNWIFSKMRLHADGCTPVQQSFGIYLVIHAGSLHQIEKGNQSKSNFNQSKYVQLAMYMSQN